jgi:dipeptidase E
MNVILTSDFPSTPTEPVVGAMRAVAATPRIAWIAPVTGADGERFAEAQQRFAALGLDQLECVDIDEERDDVQIAYLHEFDIIYLSGGDPMRFRFNAIRAGLAGRLRQCVAAGRLIVAASGGALLLTPNVSLFRLQNESVDDVVATRGRFDALAAVSYELLPHHQRWDASFLEKVRGYSARIDNDIVALADGGALFHQGSGKADVFGPITRYRKGQIIES